uniref:Disease resistance N-terminal domain-containing protein n=1 Tax=Fagus sylvatica TaxID=28930 RepID=A0A2N9HID8_FAGSY
MAESQVSFVVERLGNLLIEEVAFLQVVSQQVNQMQIELKQRQCFLRDADKKQNEDESVQIWVSEIREAIYDVQDVIETFAFEISSRNKENSLKLKHVPFFNKGIKLHKVGSKIDAIKTRISDLTRSLQIYGVNAIKEEGLNSAFDRQRQLRWSYSHIVEEYIVGLDEDIEEVVVQLINEDKHYQVVGWVVLTRDVWEGILVKLTSPTKDERDQILKKKKFEEERLGSIAQEHWTLLLCIGHNPFPLKRNGLSPVHKSTGPVEILTHLQKLDTCQDLNGSSAPVHWTQSFPFEGERLGSSAQKHLTRSDFGLVHRSTGPIEILTHGSGLGPVHRSTGPVEILIHVLKLDTCQDLNGSSAPVHRTQSFPFEGEWLGSSVQEHWTRSGLGPVHMSIGLVKILTHVQKLDTCQDLNGSSAPLHWTQSFPFEGERLVSSAQEHWTRDADKKQNEDESVQIWVSEIREAAYDVQDVIETFAFEISSRNKENSLKLKHVPIFNKGRKLHKVGSKIDAIKTRISDLTRSLQTYGVNAIKEGGLEFSLRQAKAIEMVIFPYL